MIPFLLITYAIGPYDLKDLTESWKRLEFLASLTSPLNYGGLNLVMELLRKRKYSCYELVPLRFLANRL